MAASLGEMPLDTALLVPRLMISKDGLSAYAIRVSGMSTVARTGATVYRPDL